MGKIENNDNPFPVDFVNYNLIELHEEFNAWLPIMPKKPFIIENKKKIESLFVYANNYFAIAKFLESINFDECDNLEMVFEEITEFASFHEKENKINALFFGDKYSKTFYYENNDIDTRLIRYIKTKKENGENKTLFNLNLLNKDNYLPIEKRNGDKDSLEKFYYFDDDKLFLSFKINEDLPFEVYKNNEGFGYKDYLIPNIKMKRSRLYLPSYIEYGNNGEVIDFKYFINNRDYTSEVMKILSNLNIVNPVNHSFTENEIEVFNVSIFDII